MGFWLCLCWLFGAMKWYIALLLYLIYVTGYKRDEDYG